MLDLLEPPIGEAQFLGAGSILRRAETSEQACLYAQHRIGVDVEKRAFRPERDNAGRRLIVRMTLHVGVSVGADVGDGETVGVGVGLCPSEMTVVIVVAVSFDGLGSSG